MSESSKSSGPGKPPPPATAAVAKAHIGQGAAYASRKLVLFVMASYADPDGTNCRPSMRTIAKVAEIDPRTARAAVYWLQHYGWIHPDGKPHNRVQPWRIDMEKLHSSGATSAPPEAEPVVHPLHPSGTSVAPQWYIRCTQWYIRCTQWCTQ